MKKVQLNIVFFKKWTLKTNCYDTNIGDYLKRTLKGKIEIKNNKIVSLFNMRINSRYTWFIMDSKNNLLKLDSKVPKKLIIIGIDLKAFYAKIIDLMHTEQIRIINKYITELYGIKLYEDMIDDEIVVKPITKKTIEEVIIPVVVEEKEEKDIRRKDRKIDSAVGVKGLTDEKHGDEKKQEKEKKSKKEVDKKDSIRVQMPKKETKQDDAEAREEIEVKKEVSKNTINSKKTELEGLDDVLDITRKLKENKEVKTEDTIKSKKTELKHQNDTLNKPEKIQKNKVAKTENVIKKKKSELEYQDIVLDNQQEKKEDIVVKNEYVTNKKKSAEKDNDDTKIKLVEDAKKAKRVKKETKKKEESKTVIKENRSKKNNVKLDNEKTTKVEIKEDKEIAPKEIQIVLDLKKKKNNVQVENDDNNRLIIATKDITDEPINNDNKNANNDSIKKENNLQRIAFKVVTETGEIIYSRVILNSKPVTVEELLKKTGLPIIESTSGFVESIAGLENNNNSHWWVYEVNGAPVMTSASDYIVNPEDEITWKYMYFPPIKMVLDEEEIYQEEMQEEVTRKVR